jgi:hypothetical protein
LCQCFSTTQFLFCFCFFFFFVAMHSSHLIFLLGVYQIFLETPIISLISFFHHTCHLGDFWRFFLLHFCVLFCMYCVFQFYTCMFLHKSDGFT